MDVDASLTDLRLLLEMKLDRLGPRLQLLLDSYVVSAHVSSSSWLAVQQGAKIFLGAHHAHLAASEALGHVMLMQSLPEAVKDALRAAQVQLAAEASLETAAHALMSASIARSGCPNAPLGTTLDNLQRSLRDHVVWQAQVRIPLGDRDEYMKALKLAFADHSFNIDLESQLMHTHTKLIGDVFPDAFISNTKLESLSGRRGRLTPRPARRRKRNDEHDEAKPEPTAPIPHKPGLLLVGVHAKGLERNTTAEGAVTGEAGNADSAPTAAAAAAAADTTPPVKLLADSEGKLFACGDRVRLRGLRKETALNGKAGAVVGFREDLGRVRVIIELPNTEVALVRPVNLARPQSNDLPHRVNVLDNIVLDDIL